MAKLTLEADEARLKKKVAGTQTKGETKREKGEKDEKANGGEMAVRGLRKHLKRVQRKRRRLALRKQHAKGKQAAPPSQPTAG